MPAAGTTKIPKQTLAESVALIDFMGSAQRVADVLGIDRKAIDRASRHPEIVQNAQEIKKRISIASLGIAQKYLDRLGNIVDTANVRDAAGAYKITLEGGLLASGEPTQITQHLGERDLGALLGLAELIQAQNPEKTRDEVLRWVEVRVGMAAGELSGAVGAIDGEIIEG